jgi:hypothetical protein
VGERKEDRSAGRVADVAGSEANVFKLSMINSLPVRSSSVSANPQHDSWKAHVVVSELPLQSRHQLLFVPVAHHSPTL